MALILGYVLHGFASFLVSFCVSSLIVVGILLLFVFLKSQRADPLVKDGQTSLALAQEVLKSMKPDRHEIISQLDPTYLWKVETIFFLSVYTHFLYSSFP